MLRPVIVCLENCIVWSCFKLLLCDYTFKQLFEGMPGSNCAFYSCSSSRKYEHSLFKIPVVGAADGEETAAKKRKAREEWLRLILRTREMTPELKNQIEANNVFL